MDNLNIDETQSSPKVFYEVALKKLDEQMSRIEAVDRKVSSIIGFASIIIAVLTSALKLSEPEKLSFCVITLLFLSCLVYIFLIFFSIRAYRFLTWDMRPNLEKLQEYSLTYNDLAMRYWVARECVTSYRINENNLSAKTSDARKAMYLLVIETILLVVAMYLVLTSTGL